MISVEDRFGSKLFKQGECLLFQGSLNKSGHAKFALTHKKFIGAHRYAWMISGRPLAKHKNLHHLCPNPNCCNPEHLKLTTRVLHPSLHRHEQCKHGHLLSGANLYSWKRPNGVTMRGCRKCRHRRVREYRRRIGERAAID